MRSLLRALAPSPNSAARTNLWLSLIPVGVFILARAAIELETLLGAGRAELDQLDAAIGARRAALAGAYAVDEPEAAQVVADLTDTKQGCAYCSADATDYTVGGVAVCAPCTGLAGSAE